VDECLIAPELEPESMLFCSGSPALVIRHFNKYTIITEVKKAGNVMTRLFLHFWNVSATCKFHKKKPYLKCAVPFCNFDS